MLHDFICSKSFPVVFALRVVCQFVQWSSKNFHLNFHGWLTNNQNCYCQMREREGVTVHLLMYRSIVDLIETSCCNVLIQLLFTRLNRLMHSALRPLSQAKLLRPGRLQPLRHLPFVYLAGLKPSAPFALLCTSRSPVACYFAAQKVPEWRPAYLPRCPRGTADP